MWEFVYACVCVSRARIHHIDSREICPPRKHIPSNRLPPRTCRTHVARFLTNRHQRARFLCPITLQRQRRRPERRYMYIRANNRRRTTHHHHHRHRARYTCAAIHPQLTPLYALRATQSRRAHIARTQSASIKTIPSLCAVTAVSRMQFARLCSRSIYIYIPIL